MKKKYREKILNSLDIEMSLHFFRFFNLFFLVFITYFIFQQGKTLKTSGMYSTMFLIKMQRLFSYNAR